MKKLYLILVSILFSVYSFGQTEGASKIYGYKQRVLPGTVRVNESGNPVPRKPQYNYFIYLASTCKVTPIEIWINGTCYEVTDTKLSTTPVKYSNPTSSEKTPKILVPKTTRRVLQLNPANNELQKTTQKGKTLSSKNELVVIYKGSGKLYYKTVTKLTELEQLAMQ